MLRHGDRLRAGDGRLIEVRAALEPVSAARADDPLLLTRAAYHLGNRHVPLQIDPPTCATCTTTCWTPCCAVWG